MNRSIRWLAALLALTLLLSACAPAGGSPSGSGSSQPPASVADDSGQAEPELTQVKVAYHTNLGGAAAVAIGLNLGIFEKYGFTLDLYGFTSGPVEIASMVSGELDYGFVGHGAHTLAVQGKVNVLTIGAIGNDEMLIVNADSGITDIAGLRGKTIGTTRGTAAENVLLAALQSAGLTYEDVSVVDMDVAALTVAMTTGKIDAVCTYGSARATICDTLGDKAVVLAETASFDDLMAPSSWIATPEYINRNYDQTVRFTAAIIEAMEYYYPQENRDQVYQWVSEFLEQDYETIKSSAYDFIGFSAEDILAGIEDGSIREIYQKQQQNFLDNGTVTEAVEVDSYVRFDVLKDAAELVIQNRQAG